MIVPTRLCCGQPHLGAKCPDGLAMCCICFDRFVIADLYRDDDGRFWDCCRSCAAEGFEGSE